MIFVAGLGCASPLFGDLAFIWSFAVVAIWAVLVIVALIIHGQRGLWLFVGAPFVLFWPVILVSLVEACKANINACP
jgi:hypothetical protein